ncbi:Flagellar assembly protein FliH [Pseudidiomarina piscicola]|uniref:Flagellar assembly protein FliH n=1 Tax=Pseudidiomarina piscicola TaxID=2614830 RepID=A0A6S6WML7_9GAMM|nr:flagellar assembly protein FliH [Pseudidiomarina piscicola]CAB0151053.1 Flagellar assembly protein FliH [Pseudidiomarina piscicola]VZT40563.1 Flagellar assembly protein FliH [Pseudomonas aeruginosa]
MPTFKPFELNANNHETAATADQEWTSWDFQRLPKRSTAATDEAANAQESASFEPQSELKQLREKARAEAFQQGLEQGREQGFTEGYKDGQEQAQKATEEAFTERCSKTLTPLSSMVEHFNQAVAKLDEQFAESLVQLALTVGKQLAGEALEVHPEQILTLVREILHEDPFIKDRPTLLLHPDDHTLVAEHLATELQQAGWKLRHDERVGRGGCRLVSEHGELDATLETRWQRITEQLRGSHGGN